MLTQDIVDKVMDSMWFESDPHIKKLRTDFNISRSDIVILLVSDIETNTMGYSLLPDNVIVINRSIPREEQIFTVAHEMVHFLQYREGRLSKNGNYILYENKKYIENTHRVGLAATLEYNFLPWEREANIRAYDYCVSNHIKLSADHYILRCLYIIYPTSEMFALDNDKLVNIIESDGK